MVLSPSLIAKISSLFKSLISIGFTKDNFISPFLFFFYNLHKVRRAPVSSGSIDYIQFLTFAWQGNKPSPSFIFRCAPSIQADQSLWKFETVMPKNLCCNTHSINEDLIIDTTEYHKEQMP